MGISPTPLGLQMVVRWSQENMQWRSKESREGQKSVQKQIMRKEN